MGSVADLLAMDRTTLTAALKPLERRGLVEVVSNPDDKRSRLLLLTEQGIQLLASAIPVWESTHAAVENALTDADKLRSELIALS